MKTQDAVKFFHGSPSKPTGAVFAPLGAWGQDAHVVATGRHTKRGWEVKWYAPDGDGVAFGEVTLAKWADVLRLLSLDPVQAAMSIAKAMNHASKALGFEVMAMAR